MINRILAIAVLALVLGSAPVRAQGQQRQQLVLSPSLLKSLTAQRPKSKKPLTERLSMLRAPLSNVIASSAHSAPTSVREIRKTPSRR